MKKHVNGFLDFVREQGIVGLAVGLAIGLQAGSTVSSLVNNLINPIVGFILGNTDLSNLTWSVIELDSGRSLVIGYGAILNSAITLFAVAFVVYWLVKQLGLDRLDKPKK